MTYGMSDEEIGLCSSLGYAVISWNNVEALSRLLVYKAAGGGGDRIDVLVSNLGTVAIGESLAAIADDHEQPMLDHLKHFSELFECARLSRNHFVHDPIMLGRKVDEAGEHPMALTQHTIVRSGALRLHQGSVDKAQLNDFVDQLLALAAYGVDLLAHLYRGRLTRAETLPAKPPMPDKLNIQRMKIIEAKRASREPQTATNRP